jgi:hypothetical protein
MGTCAAHVGLYELRFGDRWDSLVRLGGDVIFFLLLLLFFYSKKIEEEKLIITILSNITIIALTYGRPLRRNLNHENRRCTFKTNQTIYWTQSGDVI